MTLIDVAGSPTGGTARWRREVIAWVESNPDSQVRLIGLNRHIEPAWLMRRELIGLNERRIAATSVGFLTGRHPRVTMLRNALHFLHPGEEDAIARMPPAFARQIPIVRTVARRADVLVVPCTAMAERVAARLPRLADRIKVHHQPCTVKPRTFRPTSTPYVLFPSLPSAHKDLDGTLGLLVRAIRVAGVDTKVKVTAVPGACGTWASDPLVEEIGHQSLAQMDDLRDSASALYAPYRVESFGYALAEGRAAGIPVLAIDSAQNREIGAGALFGYEAGDVESLAAALQRATEAVLTPDPTPFDRDAFCRWLTTVE